MKYPIQELDYDSHTCDEDVWKWASSSLWFKCVLGQKRGSTKVREVWEAQKSLFIYLRKKKKK